VSGRRLAVAALLPLVLLASSKAANPVQEINVEFGDYRPSQLDVLPGETVNWTNVSTRTHTVTSDTAVFDSGQLEPGNHFTYRFDQVGAYAYHCTIHPSIVGEIDVRRVILTPLPPAVVRVGTQVDVSGRTADMTRPVEVQRRLAKGDFSTVATATPAPDGSWATKVTADATADYRALSGSDASETRRLLVSSQRVLVRPTRAGVTVSVTPSAPYTPFLVEVFLRERFGWWPVASGKVDYVSRADVRIRRPARVRVVLVDKDGWTPLATSRTVVLK
jgi:plastocyanin